MRILKGRYIKLDGIRKVAVLADPGCRKGWQKNFPGLLERVWRLHRPGAFLVAGDMSLNSRDNEYREIIGYMKDYPSVWISVPGDHDRPLRKFMKYFGATRKVVDIGRWRFICINTANRMFLRRERDWIEKNIRKDSVILSHLPPEAEGWTFHSMWPRSSNHFLEVAGKHRKKIKAMFFGHIHGFSRREYMGIPMTVTGAVAESKLVKGNRYAGKGFFEMVIFDVKTGRQSICRMD